MPVKPSIPETSHDDNLAARCVHALFERHGVPRHKRSTVVTDVLGISYSQSNRRLTTNASWSLEELKALAEHYGETLADLVSLEEHDGVVDATLVIGSFNVACRL